MKYILIIQVLLVLSEYAGHPHLINKKTKLWTD